MISSNAVEEARNKAAQPVDWLIRALTDVDGRYERASDAGATLAAEVWKFLQDPEAVGTDTLDAAYRAFMGQHAGNFHALSEP